MTYKRVKHLDNIYYGQHLLMHATGCNSSLSEELSVTDFLIELPKRIGMQAFGNPIVAEFGSGEELGFSGIQLIYSSAIVIHTNHKCLELYADVFSCRNFDLQGAVAAVKAAFEPRTITHQCIFRE